MRQFPPSRIVCLTEETVETLYLLGEQDRIVGVSGYAVRTPQGRRGTARAAASGPAQEAAPFAFPLGRYSEDPRARAGPLPPLLRSPGGDRGRADRRRH